MTRILNRTLCYLACLLVMLAAHRMHAEEERSNDAVVRASLERLQNYLDSFSEESVRGKMAEYGYQEVSGWLQEIPDDAWIGRPYQSYEYNYNIGIPGVGGGPGVQIRAQYKYEPISPVSYAGKVSPYPLKNYANDINTDAQNAADEIEEALNKVLGRGGCKGVAIPVEFQLLFNREVLKDFIKNLGDGIIAAAPMALLTALSPELANIIQHLRAVAGIALQIAKGDCSMIQGMLTNALEKVFNGKEFDECMEMANNSGLTREEALASCQNKRRLYQSPWKYMGFGLVAGTGTAINNFISDLGTSLATGQSLSAVSEQRAKQLATVQEDLEMARAKREELKQREAELAEAQRELDRARARGDAAQVSQWSAEVEAKLAAANDARATYQAAGRVVSENWKQNSPSNLRNYPPQQNSSPSWLDRIIDSAQSSISSAFQIANEATNGLVSDLWAGVSSFAQDLMSSFISPSLGITLQAGPHVMQFDFINLIFTSREVAGSLELAAEELGRRYYRCDTNQNVQSQLIATITLLYPVYESPWISEASNRSVALTTNPAVNPRMGGDAGLCVSLFGEFQGKPWARCTISTIMKMAAIVYYSKLQSARERAQGLYRRFSVKEALPSQIVKQIEEGNNQYTKDLCNEPYRNMLMHISEGAMSAFTLHMMVNGSPNYETMYDEIKSKLVAELKGQDQEALDRTLNDIKVNLRQAAELRMRKIRQAAMVISAINGIPDDILRRDCGYVPYSYGAPPDQPAPQLNGRR